MIGRNRGVLRRTDQSNESVQGTTAVPMMHAGKRLT